MAGRTITDPSVVGKQRDDHDKIQGRETSKRSLQSGEPNDTVDVELFSKKARLVGPFKKVRTREEVDFQWARAAVSAGLPMSFFATKLIPKLDEFIDNKNMGKMREMAQELAAAVFSDGWTTINV